MRNLYTQTKSQIWDSLEVSGDLPRIKTSSELVQMIRPPQKQWKKFNDELCVKVTQNFLKQFGIETINQSNTSQVDLIENTNPLKGYEIELSSFNPYLERIHSTKHGGFRIPMRKNRYWSGEVKETSTGNIVPNEYRNHKIDYISMYNQGREILWVPDEDIRGKHFEVFDSKIYNPYNNALYSRFMVIPSEQLKNTRRFKFNGEFFEEVPFKTMNQAALKFFTFDF